MRFWGYCYIENLTWVYLQPSHRVLQLPGRYANRSHLTLYMFRREGARRGRAAAALCGAARLQARECTKQAWHSS